VDTVEGPILHSCVLPRCTRAAASARCAWSPHTNDIYRPYPNATHHSTGRLSAAGNPAQMLYFNHQEPLAVETLSKKTHACQRSSLQGQTWKLGSEAVSLTSLASIPNVGMGAISPPTVAIAWRTQRLTRRKLGHLVEKM